MTGTAPHTSTNATTRLTAVADAPSWRQIAHGRPLNRSADAASGPDRSLPAIGWLPT